MSCKRYFFQATVSNVKMCAFGEILDIFCKVQDSQMNCLKIYFLKRPVLGWRIVLGLFPCSSKTWVWHPLEQ